MESKLNPRAKPFIFRNTLNSLSPNAKEFIPMSVQSPIESIEHLKRRALDYLRHNSQVMMTEETGIYKRVQLYFYNENTTLSDIYNIFLSVLCLEKVAFNFEIRVKMEPFGYFPIVLTNLKSVKIASRHYPDFIMASLEMVKFPHLEIFNVNLDTSESGLLPNGALEISTVMQKFWRFIEEHSANILELEIKFKDRCQISYNPFALDIQDGYKDYQEILIFLKNRLTRVEKLSMLTNSYEEHKLEYFHSFYDIYNNLQNYVKNLHIEGAALEYFSYNFTFISVTELHIHNFYGTLDNFIRISVIFPHVQTIHLHNFIKATQSEDQWDYDIIFWKFFVQSGIRYSFVD